VAFADCGDNIVGRLHMGIFQRQVT